MMEITYEPETKLLRSSQLSFRAFALANTNSQHIHQASQQKTINRAYYYYYIEQTRSKSVLLGCSQSNLFAYTFIAPQNVSFNHSFEHIRRSFDGVPQRL